MQQNCRCRACCWACVCVFALSSRRFPVSSAWLPSWELLPRALCSKKSTTIRSVSAASAKWKNCCFPITTLIVPVFFVMMGFRVDLKSFASPAVLGFAALITLVAIAGKQICGLGVLERGLDRLAIGVGMIPRGEVGLIFAGMGATLTLAGKPILSPTTFSALVLMIMLTTFITPPLLKMVFERKSSWS